MKLIATLLLCVATAVARLELASDTPTTINTKLEEQSFLHAELAIATRSMPTRRRGLRPSGAEIPPEPCRAAGRPGAPLRRSLVESRKIRVIPVRSG